MNRILLAGAAVAALGWAEAPTFSPDAYLAHVKYLAAPALKGRGTGTPELEKAADYIADHFKRYGLKPVADGSYYQGFRVTTNAHLGPKNRLVETLPAGQRRLEADRDFAPFNFSSSGQASAGIVFAGYGITAPEYHYDDYAGLDVKGKFVLIVLHEPQENDEKSVFAGKSFSMHAQVAIKAANAKAHGAVGVLIVKDTPAHPQEAERFEKLQTSFGLENAGIFFVQLKSEEGDRLLATAGRNLKDSLTAIDKDLKPQSVALPDTARVDLTVDVRRDVNTAHNLIGYLPGKTDEYVIIGAHYDHLGLGGPNSLAPDMAGTPHPGADDNASGTAGMLELAKWFGKQPKLNRGVLFLAFAGEEMGLIGSSYYVNHMALPAGKAVAMINLDMIGRIQNNQVHLSGIGTGTTLQRVVDEVAPAHAPLKLVVADKGGYGPSDHMSFALKQVPVLFFFSALHKDYHRPSDTWDKIDASDAAKLLSLVSDVAVKLADEPDRPQYVRLSAPPPSGGVGGGGGYGAYFGSIPDFTEIPRGVRFADVRDGSPAAKAGLKAGDILIEFDGKAIQNLYDFTNALRARKPGDEVLVKVLRDSKTIEAKVLLSQRK